MKPILALLTLLLLPGCVVGLLSNAAGATHEHPTFDQAGNPWTGPPVLPARAEVTP